jgi:hypothetical protein
MNRQKLPSHPSAVILPELLSSTTAHSSEDSWGHRDSVAINTTAIVVLCALSA